jgi:hypothetical protein
MVSYRELSDTPSTSYALGCQTQSVQLLLANQLVLLLRKRFHLLNLVPPYLEIDTMRMIEPRNSNFVNM